MIPHQYLKVRHLVYVLLAIHGVAALLCIAFPVSLGMDIFQGFEALYGYIQYHTPFHHVLKLAYHNIAENRSFFMSYFSPGHYLLPHLLSSTLNITLSTAAILTNYLCFVAGIAGFYRIYKHFDTDAWAIGFSLLVISLQLYTLEYYYTYSTADIYLFAYLPWLFLWFLKQETFRWFHFPLLVAAYLLGFLLKTSFLLLALPLAFVVPTYTALCEEKNDRLSAIKTIAGNLLSYISAFALCHYFFNRHGEHSGYANEVSFFFIDIALTVSGPLVSAFSFDKLIDLILNERLHETRVEGALQYFYWLTFALSLWLLYRYATRARTSRYHFIWLSYSLSVIGLTYILQLTNSGIDTNSRIYFLSGFLLLPQLADWIMQYPRWAKITTLIFITTIILSGIYKIVQKKTDIYYQYPQGPVTGFKYEYLQNDRSLLPQLRSLDSISSGFNNVIIVPTFGPSLEVKNLRAVTYYERWNLEWWLAQEPEYHGTVDNFYIVSYKHLSAETLPLYLSKFTDYSGYEKVTETGSFNIFRLIPKK